MSPKKGLDKYRPRPEWIRYLLSYIALLLGRIIFKVTITGQVLPIGGLKEKLLAAHRAGIKEVLIPKENEKDLIDMPKKIIDEIKITPVEYADEVLKIALTKELKKTEWVEVDISKKDDKSQASIQ